MFDEIDNALEEWASSVLEKTPVTFALPSDTETAKGVNLYLIGVATSPQNRPVRGVPPIKAELHYLVTTWAKDVREMHRMLGELFFAAMESPRWEVERGAPSPDFWKNIGVPVRPGFILKAFAVKESPTKVAPMVTKQLEISNSPMRVLDGLLLGPGKEPIMGARVEFPALNLSTSTDFGGRFRFAGIPSESAVGTVRLNVKGKAFVFPSVRLPKAEVPFVLELTTNQLTS
jgi:hypothetical protein